MSVSFEKTHNGRYKVVLNGVWIGTIAPVAGGDETEGGTKAWWYVPRGGAGWKRYKKVEGVMDMLEKEFNDGEKEEA